MSDTVRLTSVVTGTGAIIRYSFYLIGAIVLGMIGVAMLSAYNGATRTVDEKPSFHLAAPNLARYPARTRVFTGGRFGRMELLQYGSFHNRDFNFAVGMGFPPAGSISMPSPQISSLMPSNVRTVMSSNYHDMETRFGEIRGTEVRMENDGQWKQCLAFASRFDTTTLYLIGWYCDASGAKPNPASLACMLDKLTLDRDLASKEADAFMRTRITRTPTCSSTPVSQTTDTRYRSRPASPQSWSVPNAQRRNY